MGAVNRSKVFHATSAHTEYTRLLAEHGLLGLMALVLLILMAIRSLRSSASRRGKALAAAMLAYFLLHLAVDATRLAAPCFAFGLSAVAIVVQRRRTAARPALRPVGFPQPMPGA
jgi:O-antigen ligase